MSSKPRITAAFLADYANTPNGLLNVINGGINLMGRGSFPAPMNCYLAIMVDLPPGQDGAALPVNFTVGALDNEDVYARMSGEFGGADASQDEVGGTASLVLDLTGVALPRPGKFVVSATIGSARTSVHFQVQRIEPAYESLPEA